MSKPVKDMIVRDYQRRFEGIEGAVVIDIRGIDAVRTNQFRVELQKKDIRITVIKNTLATKAIAGTPLQALEAAFKGPSAIAYGAESVVDVARAIVEWTRKVKEIQLKGAVLEGQYYDGEAGVRRLSEFPTKDEAQGRVIQLVLAPAGRVLGAAKAPGARILGIVKEIQDRLEKGQAIAKAG
jgi:large subunit ribosomal protein L10